MIALLRSIPRWLKAKPPMPAVETSDNEAQYRPIDLALIRRLVSWYRPYRLQYIAGVLIAVVHVLLEMSSPRFMQHIINYVTGYLGHTTAATQHQAIMHLVMVVALWAGVFLASILLQRYVILVSITTGERVQFDLRRALFVHLQKLSMSFYDRTKLGRIISRCTSDIVSLREVNVWGVQQILINSMVICVSAIMLLTIDWRLFLCVAWLAPVLVVTNRYYGTKAGYLWQMTREGFSRISTNLAENITGVRVVTAFNRQDQNISVFDSLQVQNTDNNLRVARLNGLYQPVLELIRFIGRTLILCVGGYLVVTSPAHPGATLTVGAVVAGFMYWDWLMNPIVALGAFYNQLMAAMAGAERVFNLLDTPIEVSDHPTAIALPRIKGHVRFENVTFGYKPETPVLHEVSFEAEPGQTIALVGATGSGKSSIISLIARFYLPQRGRILVDGHDIRHVTSVSLHHQMGLVLQQNYLFTGTVLENINYANPSASREQVIDASRAIGSFAAISALQKGFDSEVGERGANMSLGQRQLICFTRAFLADPRIFMLDEATSAVDTSTELMVQASLERLITGRTTFVVAHRLSTIKRADQILVIDAGRIIERGGHDELRARGGRYAALYDQFVHHVQ